MFAKNWQDEALKIVEKTVSLNSLRFLISHKTINRWRYITKIDREPSLPNHLPPKSTQMGNTFQRRCWDQNMIATASLFCEGTMGKVGLRN
jgi:hypothetical protein